MIEGVPCEEGEWSKPQKPGGLVRSRHQLQNAQDRRVPNVKSSVDNLK